MQPEGKPEIETETGPVVDFGEVEMKMPEENFLATSPAKPKSQNSNLLIIIGAIVLLILVGLLTWFFRYQILDLVSPPDLVLPVDETANRNDRQPVNASNPPVATSSPETPTKSDNNGTTTNPTTSTSTKENQVASSTNTVMASSSASTTTETNQ